MILINLHNQVRPSSRRSLRIAALALLAVLSGRLEAQSVYPTPFTFVLLAGEGSPGSADGTGTAAQFNQPFGVTLDSSGNLFVADKNNHVIREITSGGVVTTFAGTAGSFGTADGTGAVARFNDPTGVTAGSGGDLYVADSGNNTIRKITAQGVVTTLAGTAGTAGSTNGAGAAGLFNQPHGIAIDSSGNLYIADFGNNMIRMVTQAGAVTTLAGVAAAASAAETAGAPADPGHADGTGASASFNQPAGIAIDSGGNLYVADSANDIIRKITPAGVVTTLAGSAGAAGSSDGTGSAARFNSPRGVAVDGSGNVFVADSGNSSVRKITSAGVVTTLAGSPGHFANVEGTGAAAIFDAPSGIAVDSSGILYLTEELGDVVSKGAVATTSAPLITQQPSSQTIVNGTTVVFHADATGLPAPTYQWFYDGGAIPGSTGATLVIAGATAANAGSYSYTAANSSGTVQSGAATLTVSSTTDVGRLVNISCRSAVGTGGNILIAGFAIGGAGTSGTAPLLIRASGPALASFDVAGFLPDPELQLFANSSLLGSDSAWGGSTLIADTAAAVGAFAWTIPTSHDSALVETLAAGPYSAQVSGQSGDTGVALAEVYDTTPAGSYTPATPRLVNISARTQVGTGANVLIAGFVIGGSTSKTVLIRASGPALASFNVSGLLPDPELQLYAGSTLVDTDDGWAGDPEIAAAAAEVGAFSWGTASTPDSALLVTLPPGTYTAQVSGASGDSGIALVEVYEVP
jgi:sugar lactone lactonase YvrE